MKSVIEEYVSYNLWANKRLCEMLKDSSADIEMKSSFGSIRKTFYHMWDAQEIWLSRLQGQPLADWPSKSFTGSLQEAKKLFIKSSESLLKWVQENTEQELEAEFIYTNMQGKKFTNTVRQILMHVCNHATFHRGQVVTMLRTADEAEILPSDLIVYYRELSPVI